MKNVNTAPKEFTILLVDDKPENIVSLEEILAAPNRNFLHAYNGNDALKLALKHEQIGLIMLDVQMPGMDGYEVARILKTNAKTKEKAVIFVTAINKEEQFILKGFEEGAVDYLQKPLDVNVTKAKVNVFEKLYFSQQELKLSLIELEKVNKQLERFVSVASHDLKSPLASVVTILSILKNHPVVNQHNDLQDSIDMVYMSSTHLATMIESILRYSRQSLNEQEIEEVDTYELVNQVVFLLFPPKHISITVSDSLPVFRTRKQKLQQVIQNLISNAIKYNDKPAGKIEIGATEKEDFYEFYVRDNGPGIRQVDESRIFKLFEVTENKAASESSTGVGLNIIKLLVEEQGGRIWVESEPGSGSTFFFTWRK
ncbi:hybrid sensor histidine kinase/response regulator [Aridibaculum aurantiacum]|uniref:hybrid sensor histidine kinase/response regulator n=1 Tax=Aridibaculum aurantiacum TaxID=2810307 RepID=UPI001A97CD0C|nr:hybrid sensor histidine kinase/response regulator [Aridibaculum aurantiacum]